ncbi:MAG: sialate O-acetylesterase [Planctomycetota bacterium]
MNSVLRLSCCLICVCVCLPRLRADNSVPVFVLLGQSNMQGHGFTMADPKRNGGKGSLEWLVHSSGAAESYAHLLEKGEWRQRSDVWVSYLEREGPLSVGFGARPDRIGPELGFGTVLGDHFDEPVVLIKCAWGGKSLAVDFRPPSAGDLPYSLGGKKDVALEKDPLLVGRYFRESLDQIERVMKALRRDGLDLPGLDAASSQRDFEIAGVGWHQGWNDRIHDQHNAHYAGNMVHFIHDMSDALQKPSLPFVIAESGMTGPEEKHPRALALMKSQASIAKREEFEGSVAFVPTQSFWRAREESPTGQGYHWNSNAETYYLIGEAMGKAMLGLTR